MSAHLKKKITIVAAALALFVSSLAAAAPPPSVAGTWNIIGNQLSGSLSLAQAATAASCKPISGTIYSGLPGAGTVVGYYCPTTGRLAFARKNSAGNVNQTWSGNVSDVVAGQPLRLGGTFHSVHVGAGGGALGEYHFQGQK